MTLDIPTGATTAEVGAIARVWLRENLPTDWRDAAEAGRWREVDAIRADRDRAAAFFVTLGEAGLAAPTWPREYLGLGLDEQAAAGVTSALLDYHADRPLADFVGMALASTTILQWGTDEQKKRFLPPLALGQEHWCQLFSEPGAGSDLASLSTRAEPQPEGGWIVNGQKVWSSYAHIADFGLLMARTDGSLPKHRGISYFLLDMKSPGVQPRPLRQMTGEAEFNEVFLTDVRVPEDALIGPLNSGWSVAISTLMAERSGLTGRPSISPGRAADLAAHARRTGTWDDPLLRDRLMQLFVTEKALQMTTLRAYAESGSALPGAEGSVRKLVNADLDEYAGTLAVDLDPADALAWDPSAAMPDTVHAFLAMKTISIAGGTSEIQRNIIGERMLGLAKDPDPDKDVAFDQRRRG